jgi:rare lipoprotein A
MNKHRNALLIAFACCVGNSAWAAHHAHPGTKHSAHAARQAQHKAGIDRSGKPRKGMASYYNGKGRRMADGTRFDPHAKTAASKTLPLGTKARVTNLETGKSETVEVRDRGPYVDGRIVDVTPRVAQDLEMKKDGVAPVEVKPLAVPPPGEDR